MSAEVQYSYVPVGELVNIGDLSDLAGLTWKVIEVCYGNNGEFYNSHGRIKRLTLAPVVDSACAEDEDEWPEVIEA